VRSAGLRKDGRLVPFGGAYLFEALPDEASADATSISSPPSAGDLPRTRREVKHHVHGPHDQRRLYERPEAVDVEAADNRLRDYQHQQRHKEPGNPQGENRQRECHQSQERLQRGVEYPENCRGLEQGPNIRDMHSGEQTRYDREHERVRQPGDTKSDEQRG
jgi:hypothetical protein